MSANGPYGMAIYDGDLFITNYGAGTIGEYDATTGATVNAALVSGLTNPTGIVFAPASTPLPSAVQSSFVLLAGLGVLNAVRGYRLRRRTAATRI